MCYKIQNYTCRHAIYFLIFFVAFINRTTAQQKKTILPSGKSKTINHQYFFQNHLRKDTVFVNSSGFAKSNLHAAFVHSAKVAESISNPIAIESSGTKNKFKILGTITLNITSTGTSCGYSNGTISVSPSGGTAPYSFSENGYPFQSSGTFIGLAAGTYSVTVNDANGTSANATVILTNTFSPPVVNVLTYTNVSSCISTDASVTLTGSGGTPPYTYSIDGTNFQISNLFSNIPAGFYSFFIQDANGCVAPISFNLGTPCNISFGFTYSNYVCTNEGYLSFIRPTGGVAPYTFSIDGTHFQTSPDFTNLSAGIYYGYIRDATGLVMIYAFPIYHYCPIDITVNETDATCGNNNGSIVVNATNGATPYLYSTDGINFQTNNTFSGLAAGNYTVTVKDANGAVSSLNAIIINQNCPIITADSTNETCSNKNGTITAAGANGTLPYQFSIDGTNFQTSAVFSNLAHGNYRITIKDAAGFISSTSIAVNNICDSIKAVSTNATCGNNNGTITVTGFGGIAPYQYSINGSNFLPNNTFSGLGAGTYIIAVKDAANLMNDTSIFITNTLPPAITAITSAASCSNNDGSITVNNFAGTLPLEYSIDGNTFQASTIFSGLASGNYTILAKDINGCTVSNSITVQLNNSLQVDAGKDTTICEGMNFVLQAASDGNIFLWTPSAGLDNPSLLNPVASPATTTIYTLTGSKGLCNATSVVTVFVNPAPIANAGEDSTICFGKSIQLSGSGGVYFSWSPKEHLSDPGIAGPMVIDPSNTITYYLTVKNANGCASLAPSPVTITVTPTASVFAGNDTSIAINEPLQLNVQDVNNSGFTQYIWSPSIGLDNPYIQNPVATLTNDISYTVTAITDGGCEGTSEITVKVFAFADIFVPNAFTPNNDGRNDVLRPITAGIKEFKFFAVFNRWGQKIFYSNDQSKGWDGTINGVPQNPGTFVWFTEGVTFKGNTISKKGTVVLIR